MRRLALLPVLVVLLAGCGGEKSNVSGGVDAVNRELAARNAELDCPDEVEGGAGTEFECDLKGTRTGKTVKIQMKIVEQGGELAIDFAGERAAVQRAIEQVTAA